VNGVSAPLGDWYRSSRLRITELVDDDVARVRVPATPLWDIRDVIAHLAGIAEDARTGNMAGATTDAWTADQVERGRGRPVRELVARWADDAAAVEIFLSTPEGAASAWRAVLDIHTHEADLLNALGRPVLLPTEVLGWLRRVLIEDFREAVAAAGLPPVDVDTTDLEVFRGRLGRRTVEEVCAYRWSADPEPYLGCWFIFGRAERSLAE
jgi:uncharacterized protein (TIGR03083 family)